MAIVSALQLTPLEIASGYVLGEDGQAPRLPEVDPSVSPLQALREAVLPALSRPPCMVSFSGGRDSSVVLAVAVDAARREGLDLPIPVTLRFPRAAETEEQRWQETVISHLGLDDWLKRAFDDELDLLGPVAQGVLLRHGLLWPSNTHFHQPLLEEANGGSLLTGIDGDQLFGWRWARAAAVLSGRARPTPRDILRIGLAFAPGPIRRRAERARKPKSLEISWLKPNVRRAVEAAVSDEVSAEPRRWDEGVKALARSRPLTVAHACIGAIAEGENVLLIHPFSDHRFLERLALTGGRFGFGDRGQAMQELFGELLPVDVLARTSKAAFGGAFWGPHTRAFVEQWPGNGIADDLVDQAALRTEWLSDEPNFASSVSLQAAWLAAAPRPG